MNSTTPLADVAREWFQKVWNERDESTIDRMLNVKGQLDGLPMGDSSAMRGPEEFKPFYRAILSAIPDIHVTVTHVIEQGDMVAVRFVCEGTHSGEGLGVPPGNKRVSFSSLGLGRVANRQWVEGWNLLDIPSLNRQIGGALRMG